MVELVANRIADYFTDNKLICEEEKQVYIYAGQTLILKLINWIIALLIGIIMGQFIGSVICLACFVNIRKYSGGYHANTPLRCGIVTNSMVVIINIIVKDVQMISIFNYLGMIIAAIIIVSLAPVQNKNYTLDESECAIFKKKTAVIVSSFIVIALVLDMLSMAYSFYSSYIILSVFAVAIASVAGYGMARSENNCRVEDRK